MSGIAGIYTFDGSEPPESLLHALSHHLNHRGKDDSGISILGGLGLVHQRLAVAPLDAGHQPLSNDSQLTLITDCRLLRTEHMREQFKDKYNFTTSLDCEIIFPLYDKYGAEFASHLDGMYALALYDGHTQELVLARDEVGIKPLYYAQTESYFVFSSELKVLLTIDEIRKEIDRQARNEFLQYGTSLGGQTIVHSVKAVLPGETLILQKGQIIKRFKRKLFDNLETSKTTLKKALVQIPSMVCESLADLEEPQQELACLLETPPDYFLAHTLSESFGDRVHYFNLVLDGRSNKDELEFEASHIVDVEFNEKDFWQTIPFVAATIDEPSVIPEHAVTYKLCQEVKKEYTVVFSSLGSKLLSANMNHLKQAKRWQIFGGRLLPQRGTFQSLRDAPTFFSDWRAHIDARIKSLKEEKSLTSLQQAQVLEFENRFSVQKLGGYERILASFGLEPRLPFLDKKLRETLLTLPDSVKISGGETGVVLYEMARQVYPQLDFANITYARREALDKWIKEKASRLGAIVSHHEEIASLFSRDFVRDVFTCRDKRHTKAAWTILLYALWHQAHIKKIQPVPDTLSFLSAKS